MPELPEVEIAARNLRRWAQGRRIESVVADPRAKRIFRPATPRAFAVALTGARLEAIRRVGKQLLVTLDTAGGPLGLLSHLGMSGKWVRRADAEAPPSHSRARLELDDGFTLHYDDPRLFGRLRLVPEARFEEVPEVRALGPDPLEQGIDPARLTAAFARIRRPIKVTLLDQRLLPGVGNIHASEALFRARVDPRRPAASLSKAEVRRLAQAVLDSFHDTVALEDAPEITYVEEPGAPNPFLVYGKEGEPCLRCHRGTIRRIVQAQRSTFFCPSCQRSLRPSRSVSKVAAAGSFTGSARSRSAFRSNVSVRRRGGWRP
jgi:formamidopyrimidine-DNA glycosylase